MFNGTVKKYPWSLIHVPDRYVRLREMWHGYYSHVMVTKPWLYDKIVEWRNCQKQRRALNKTKRNGIYAYNMSSFKMAELLYVRE